MHPKVRQALEEIDAAVMNGATFTHDFTLDPNSTSHTQVTADRLTLHTYLNAWLRELAPTKAELAQAIRDAKIAALQRCNCMYPMETFRNGSGHKGTCPVHAAWLKAHAERQAKETP